LVDILCYKKECRGFESREGGFFNLFNPSSRTMTMGSTQPLTEMSTKNRLKCGRRLRLISTVCKPSVYTKREPRYLTNLWAFTSCYRDNITFFYLKYAYILGARERSRYSEGLHIRRLGFDSNQGQHISLHSTVSRPVLEPTHKLIPNGCRVSFPRE
jgi:hypothetical protein